MSDGRNDKNRNSPEKRRQIRSTRAEIPRDELIGVNDNEIEPDVNGGVSKIVQNDPYYNSINPRLKPLGRDIEPESRQNNGNNSNRLREGIRNDTRDRKGSAHNRTSPKSSVNKVSDNLDQENPNIDNIGSHRNVNADGTPKSNNDNDSDGYNDSPDGSKSSSKSDFPDGSKDSEKSKGLDGRVNARDVMNKLGVGDDSEDSSKSGRSESKGDFVDDGEGPTAVDAAKAVSGAVSGTVAAGKGAGVAMTGMIVAKGVAAAKGIVSSIVGFGSSIITGLGSMVSGVLGATATVGNIVATVIVTGVVAVSSVVGIGMVEQIRPKDTSMFCVAVDTKVPSGSQDYIMDGEASAIREANAIKLWSVYSQIGGTKEKTAAVLGNLQAESNLDPTSLETIYDEPFAIGPRKSAAIGYDFDVKKINPRYSAKYPAIKRVGIGLAQWTNDRNSQLLKYAEEVDGNWYDFDTQIMFMLDGESDYRKNQLKDFITGTSTNVEHEAEKFMNTWIGLSSPNKSLSARKKNAVNFMFILEMATVDTDYAESILSGMNVDRSQGNHSASAYHQDDGCGNAILTHYNDKAADGTGEVPPGLALVAWTPSTFPDSLKEFAADPKDVGMAYGSGAGWDPSVMPGQCVGFASSYFMQIYPEWNQGGRPKSRPRGNGVTTAGGWARHYGEPTTKYPESGAVFSDSSTSKYGHTGIVQHVFANGDILIVEQNIPGISGDHNNTPFTWGWRVISKAKHSTWTFFKPKGAQPQWNGPPSA